MSKFQSSYNQAKKKELVAVVPSIQDDIRKWEEIKKSATDPYSKKAADARIQALKIKMNSYKKGDPVKEEVEIQDEVYVIGIRNKFIEGKNAFKEGKLSNENPYDRESEEYSDWLDGWSYAWGKEFDRTHKKEKSGAYTKIDVEESQSAITTGNIGSPTMATGEPAKGGSSALYYPKVGSMVSRRGDIKPKKKKKIREFSEYYFNENEEKIPYGEQIQIQ